MKVGRTPGLRLGYSQIANPAYLVGKGTMRIGHALGLVTRNVAMNLIRSVSPEPYIDRRGRLRGNMLALRQIVRGRADPRQVRELGD